MCVKPLMAWTSPEMRIAASWISDASSRTEQPAAAQRRTASRAGPSTAAAMLSRASKVTAVSARAIALPESSAVIVEPVGHGILALGPLQRRQHARRRRQPARRANHVDGLQLLVGEAGGAEDARGALGLLEPILEQHGTPLDRGRRIVQLVGESGRQLAERRHLLVVQVVRREQPRAIDHLVHEDGRHLVALADHLGQLVAVQRQDRARRLRDGIAWRAHHP